MSGSTERVQVARYGGVWEFRIPEVGVVLLVRKVRTERGGEVKVEVDPKTGTAADIRQLRPLAAAHMFNLSATRTKSEWANGMNKRLDLTQASITWGDIAELVAMRVIDDHRRGEPFQLLATVDAPKAQQFLIAPFLPLDDTTVLLGDGGSGKSLMAVYTSVCVATGTPWLHTAHPTRPGPVAYLDWETNAAAIRRRADRVCAGLEIDVPTNIWHRHCTRPLVEEIEELASEVAALEATLVVVDSLGWALGADPNDSAKAIEFMTALREFGATVLVVAHPPKGELSSEEARSVAGVGFFRYGARAVWEVRHTLPDDVSMRLQMHQRKVNDTAMSKLPLVANIEFARGEGDPVIVTPAGQVEMADLKGMTLEDRIRFALGRAQEPVTIAQITKWLQRVVDINEKSVRPTLNRMPDVVNVAPAGAAGAWCLRSKAPRKGV